MIRDPLAPFEPTAADPFDLAKVGHLLRRAGFQASLAVRRRLARQGLDAAWAFVTASATDPTTDRWADVVAALGDVGRVRAHRVWLALSGRAPLRHRVSYFWHGHFATGNQKILDPRAMAAQQATFDRLGLGRFDELAAAMCRDPALLRWLDNDVNTDEHPNENFARELFELFTLGRGHYSEADVREAARCFTGWHVRHGRFRFVAHRHDGSEERVLRAEGATVRGDVLRLPLPRRESDPILADRGLRWSVHPEPTADEVAALADVYQQNDRRVGPTLATLLRSRLFFSRRAWRSKVKSPADFVVGTVRLLDGRAAPAALARTMAGLGETWLEPPSVEGWHGERAWLSEASWLLRSNFVADLLAGRAANFAPRPGTLFAGLERPDHYAKASALLLLDDRVAALQRLEAVAADARGDEDRRAAAVLHAAACLPDYQLA